MQVGSHGSLVRCVCVCFLVRCVQVNLGVKEVVQLRTSTVERNKYRTGARKGRVVMSEGIPVQTGAAPRQPYKSRQTALSHISLHFGRTQHTAHRQHFPGETFTFLLLSAVFRLKKTRSPSVHLACVGTRVASDGARVGCIGLERPMLVQIAVSRI